MKRRTQRIAQQLACPTALGTDEGQERERQYLEGGSLPRRASTRGDANGAIEASLHEKCPGEASGTVAASRPVVT